MRPTTSSVPAGTQLNWLARYIPIKEHLSGAALSSLLEVGSGARGLSCVLRPSSRAPGAPSFVGIDTKFSETPDPSMIPLCYGGGRLPFKDGAFHTVVSMDTLEHVPPPARATFIQEMARVASSRVIVGFPSVPGTANGNGNGNGHADGQEGEKFLQGLFRALGMSDPDWLHEHEQLGLPTSSDVEAVLGGLRGWSWRRLKTTGNLVNLMAVLMDVLPGAAAWVEPVLGQHGDELESWFRAGMFGPANRAVYLLERRELSAPLVDLSGGEAGSLVRALSCPGCQGNLEGSLQERPGSPSPPEMTCVACRQAFTRDARGVVSLVAAPGPVTFHLAPDWLGSRDWIAPVHRFLHGFSADDPCRLWLDLAPGGVDAAQALALLNPILAPFGDRPFAELYLNDDPNEQPRAALPAREALATGAPETPETPDETVRRLHRNKKIFDAVETQQAHIQLERARAARPDIWNAAEPLVTVRIITYNRPRLIVERAIASVLRQTYQNFEILIVGDHAVPETADAVAAVGDPRIRYFNLPERGRYPSFPRYFWSCAGAYASLRSFELCRGDWMTWLDDDDEYPPDHIEALLNAARRTRAEMVFGVSEYENADGSWKLLGRFVCGQICSGSVMFSSRLLFMRPDFFCWINEEPGDWNLWRRMHEAGVRIGFTDRVVFRHFAEKTMAGPTAADRQRLDDEKPTPEQILSDVLHTSGHHFLSLV